jgi:hypothetical protein
MISARIALIGLCALAAHQIAYPVNNGEAAGQALRTNLAKNITTIQNPAVATIILGGNDYLGCTRSVANRLGIQKWHDTVMPVVNNTAYSHAFVRAMAASADETEAPKLVYTALNSAVVEALSYSKIARNAAKNLDTSQFGQDLTEMGVKPSRAIKNSALFFGPWLTSFLCNFVIGLVQGKKRA